MTWQGRRHASHLQWYTTAGKDDLLFSYSLPLTELTKLFYPNHLLSRLNVTFDWFTPKCHYPSLLNIQAKCFCLIMSHMISLWAWSLLCQREKSDAWCLSTEMIYGETFNILTESPANLRPWRKLEGKPTARPISVRCSSGYKTCARVWESKHQKKIETWNYIDMVLNV